MLALDESCRMFLTILKNLLIAICFSSILGTLLIGIIDPDILAREPYSDNGWASFVMLSASLWFDNIFIYCFLFVVVFVWCLEGTKKLLGKINISGNMLIPVMIFIYALIVAGLILFKDITYPIPYPRTYNEDFKMVMSVFLLVLVSFSYKAFLISLNWRLSEPASIFVIVLPFLPIYIGFSIWLHYAYTGVVDFLWFITSLFVHEYFA